MQSGWTIGVDSDLTTYAGRYHAFLDAYEGTAVVTYEDLVRAPEETMQRVCAILGVSYEPGFREHLAATQLSGSSGRSSNRIGPRHRRSIPAAIERDRGSQTYRDLCTRMGYEP